MGDEKTQKFINETVLKSSILHNKTFQVTFFKNESQLEDFDASDAGGKLDFGIIFDEIPHEKLSYKIRSKGRFPSAEARTNDGTGCRPTDDSINSTIFNPLDGSSNSIPYCQPTNYYHSGFLGLQAAIDFSWISSRPSPNGNGFNFPQEILLQLVPKIAFVGGTVTVLRSIIPLYLVISLSQFVPPMLLV